MRDLNKNKESWMNGMIMMDKGIDMSSGVWGREFGVRMFGGKIERMMKEVEEWESFGREYIWGGIVSGLGVGMGKRELGEMKEGWVESGML